MTTGNEVMAARKRRPKFHGKHKDFLRKQLAAAVLAAHPRSQRLKRAQASVKEHKDRLVAASEKAREQRSEIDCLRDEQQKLSDVCKSTEARLNKVVKRKDYHAIAHSTLEKQIYRLREHVKGTASSKVTGDGSTDSAWYSFELAQEGVRSLIASLTVADTTYIMTAIKHVASFPGIDDAIAQLTACELLVHLSIRYCAHLLDQQAVWDSGHATGLHLHDYIIEVHIMEFLQIDDMLHRLLADNWRSITYPDDTKATWDNTNAIKAMRKINTQLSHRYQQRMLVLPGSLRLLQSCHSRRVACMLTEKTVGGAVVDGYYRVPNEAIEMIKDGICSEEEVEKRL